MIRIPWRIRIISFIKKYFLGIKETENEFLNNVTMKNEDNIINL